MKNLILLLILSIIFTSCTVEGTDVDNTNTNTSTTTIVEIDECEYVQFRTYMNYYGITHKGNCKFCKKRLDELIHPKPSNLTVYSIVKEKQ